MSCIKIIITKVKIKNEYYIIFIKVSYQKNYIVKFKVLGWDSEI